MKNQRAELSSKEMAKLRYTHYVSRALALGLKDPEALVKRLVKKEVTSTSRYFHNEFKKALTKQTKKKPRVSRFDITINKLDPIMCALKSTPMCLGMFIPVNKSKACVRCKTHNTPN